MDSPTRFPPAIRRFGRLLSALPALGALPHAGGAAGNAPLGLFENHGDIGEVRQAGSVSYDPTQGTYVVAGSGENMWAKTDAFQYVWKQASGDLSLAADVAWLGTGGNPHKKAGLIIRQCLEADSPYVDAVVHGDGLASIQFRQHPGETTHEMRAQLKAPRRLGLRKDGDTIVMLAGDGGNGLQPTGGAVRIAFKAPFYVGIGVCAHDADAIGESRLLRRGTLRDSSRRGDRPARAPKHPGDRADRVGRPPGGLSHE